MHQLNTVITVIHKIFHLVMLCLPGYETEETLVRILNSS